MTEMEFGKIIEKLIYFSGEKNYSLARTLGYDVSYLSKWISGTMFPASKNIKIICDKIADFIIDHNNGSSLDEIIEYFNIDEEKCGSEEDLKEYIKNMLYKSYLSSRENKGKKHVEKNSREVVGKCNSVIMSNPRFVKSYLDENILGFLQKEGKGEVIVLSNLFSLGRDDKLHTAGIRKGWSSECPMGNVDFKFLISFDEDIDDLVFNTILLINMMTVYANTNFELYSCNHSKYSQIVVVKNKSFSHAVYTDTKKCLFVSTSEDKVVVDEMYKSLEELMDNRAKPTFLEMNSKEMILEKKYMQYIIGRDLRWLMGDMNELLMPSDLFMELGRDVFGEDQEVMRELENINTILQNATYKSNIQVLIYESTIKTYISTGKLNFFNININLTLEQIQRHIEYMENLIKTNDNIEIKLITDNLIEDFKDLKNPSAFISKSLNYINVNCVDGINDKNKYLIVKDSKLDKIFRNFFGHIWSSQQSNITENREEVFNRFSDLLGYIKILNDNM